MAKLLSSIKRFIGESGELKATDCPNGSTFLETDTGNMYVFIEGDWRLKEEANVTLRIENIKRMGNMLDELKKVNENLELVLESIED